MTYHLDQLLKENPRALNTDPRTVTWDTNYNGKMSNQGFLHIDLRPKREPLRSVVEKIEITIYTADNSHPPIKVKMLDLLIIRLKNISTAFTLASHGLEIFEFVNQFLNKFEGKLTMHDEVAIYYYQKM